MPAVGEVLAPAGAADVMNDLPKRLAEQVRAIDVGGPSVALVLAGAAGTTDVCQQQVGGVQGRQQIRFGTFEHSRVKGLVALAVLDHLAGQPFTYIDVSAPRAPVTC